MVFGIFVDVPLLSLTFVGMVVFRKRLAIRIVKTGLPPIALYLLLSVPLIVFEEDIDCMPSWCGTVLIPPTLPFLLLEMLVLGTLALLLHAKSPIRVTLVYCVFGILWEILVGGLRGAPLVVVVLLAPYVALGYAFVSMLPLTVLIVGKRGKSGLDSLRLLNRDR